MPAAHLALTRSTGRSIAPEPVFDVLPKQIEGGSPALRIPETGGGKERVGLYGVFAC